ncbi:MAG: ABC transporter permease [Methanobacterium sp.]|nr:ABC transporter permease [Methanobacterium sp.]
MKFRSLIFKNIFRNKSRSALTVFGIAIGVAAVIGLGLLTEGLPSSAQNALTAGAADFSVIAKTTNIEGAPSGPGGMGEQQLISQDYVKEIQKISGVNSAVGVLRTMTNLDNSSASNSSTTNSSSQSPTGDFRSMTSLIGIDKNSLSMDDIVITNGTVFSGENEVIIGKRAAERSGKTIGNNITISNQTFQIVGIFETGNFQDDSGIVMSLDKLQNLTGDSGKISLILVKAENGTDTSKLANTIQNKYPNELTTSTSLSGMERMNEGLNVINTAVWGISLLAILIGGIIAVITMMKAVSERTREIGVLRAIGWSKKRIIKMIIGESILLSLIAIVIGIIIGISVVEILSSTHMLPGLQPSFSVLLFLKGIVVALLLGIIGGIYPAYRASKLEPTEALRYE